MVGNFWLRHAMAQDITILATALRKYGELFMKSMSHTAKGVRA